MGEEFNKVIDGEGTIYKDTSDSHVKCLERENARLERNLVDANNKIETLVDLLAKERNKYNEACEHIVNIDVELADFYSRLMSAKAVIFHHDSTVRMSKEVRSTLEKIFNI